MSRSLVVDTGALVALASIDRLNILKPLADEVLVPSTVHQEIMADGAGTVSMEAYLPLRRSRPTLRRATRLLPRNI